MRALGSFTLTEDPIQTSDGVVPLGLRDRAALWLSTARAASPRPPAVPRARRPEHHDAAGVVVVAIADRGSSPTARSPHMS